MIWSIMTLTEEFIFVAHILTHMFNLLHFGPSEVRALPLAAGLNVSGHYFGPSGAVQTVSDSRRPLFCIFWSERRCADGV